MVKCNAFFISSLKPFSVEFQIVAPDLTSWTELLEGRMLNLGSGPGRSAFTSRLSDMFAVPLSSQRGGFCPPLTVLSSKTQMSESQISCIYSHAQNENKAVLLIFSTHHTLSFSKIDLAAPIKKKDNRTELWTTNISNSEHSFTPH